MTENELGLLGFYCLLILAASLAGGWIPLLVRLTHLRLQIATSFVAGLMLGVGVLHLLPHSWHETRSIDLTARWALVGFLGMFFLQRFFHFHHHDVVEESPEVACCSGQHGAAGDPAHGQEHRHEQTLAERSALHLSWGGAAVGLALHSVIDGVALAASVAVDSGGAVGLAGFGTFLVVLLHKPFDSMAIATLMARSNTTRTYRHWVNGIFALAIPAGAMLFGFGAARSGVGSELFIGVALAASAGVFLCIAASDLLPELQFHTHDRGWLSSALIAGLVLSLLIGHFESHGHDDSSRSNAKPDPASENHHQEGHRH